MYAGFGARRPRYEDSIWDADDATREARFEERWALGGLGFSGAFGDMSMTEEANNFGAEFIRQKIRGIVESLGMTVATPDEARQRLALKGADQVKF